MKMAAEIAAFAPAEAANPMLLVICPVAPVTTPIVPRVRAHAALLPVHVVPLEDGLIGPRFQSEAVLLVVAPLTRIPPNAILIGSRPIAHIITPMSNIRITIRMCKRPLPMRCIKCPLPHILRTLGPRHDTSAVAEAAQPFAFVRGAGLVAERGVGGD